MSTADNKDVYSKVYQQDKQKHSSISFPSHVPRRNVCMRQKTLFGVFHSIKKMDTFLTEDQIIRRIFFNASDQRY